MHARKHSGAKAAKHFDVGERQIRYWKKQHIELPGAEKGRVRLSDGGRKKVSEDLETALIDWVHDMRDKHNRVSRKVIQLKARKLYSHWWKPACCGQSGLAREVSCT